MELTFENMVIKTGAAIPNMCRNSLGDGTETAKLLKPFLFRASIIIYAATIWMVMYLPVSDNQEGRSSWIEWNISWKGKFCLFILKFLGDFPWLHQKVTRKWSLRIPVKPLLPKQHQQYHNPTFCTGLSDLFHLQNWPLIEPSRGPWNPSCQGWNEKLGSH